MPDRTHEILIQRHLAHWNRLRSALQSAHDPTEVKPAPVVTISRQAGCNSREVADTLGRRLDLRVFGREIVDEIARDRHLESEVVAQLDERVASSIQQWVRGLLDRRIFLADDYHLALVRVVRTLAAHGGVVLVGRGANFILAERADLRLRLVGTEDTRKRNFARAHGVGEPEALTKIRELDEGSEQFVRRLFRVEAAEPSHYDLVLNVDRLGPAAVADLAERTLRDRGWAAARASG
jgi:cytidylate kinase